MYNLCNVKFIKLHVYILKMYVLIIQNATLLLVKLDKLVIFLTRSLNSYNKNISYE